MLSVDRTAQTYFVGFLKLPTFNEILCIVIANFGPWKLGPQHGFARNSLWRVDKPASKVLIMDAFFVCWRFWLLKQMFVCVCFELKCNHVWGGVFQHLFNLIANDVCLLTNVCVIVCLSVCLCLCLCLCLSGCLSVCLSVPVSMCTTICSFYEHLSVHVNWCFNWCYYYLTHSCPVHTNPRCMCPLS